MENRVKVPDSDPHCGAPRFSKIDRMKPSATWSTLVWMAAWAVFRLPLTAAEAPQELLLDACDSGAGWEVDPGREFPGATGTLVRDERNGHPCLRVDFDFSKGGNYFGVARDADIPEATEIRLVLAASGLRHGMVRLRDASGQEFLGGFSAAGDDWAKVTLPLNGETFKRHWGGANDGVFHWPIRRLLIAANGPGQGRFWLRDLALLTADHASRWRLSITAPEPGHVAFAGESPPLITVAARNCTPATVQAELRCSVRRDDGLVMLRETQTHPFSRWERRDWQWPLPAADPGHYLVTAELVSGAETLARAEGGIAVVPRPARFGQDDPDSFFGLHVSEPAAAARIGVKWTRVFRQWWWVESSKGRYWWPDELSIDGARAQGMRILLTLDAGPPSWAKKELLGEGEALWPFPDALAGAYERYIREAARHYRDKVDVFEIQNEPDLSCWRHENLPFAQGLESFLRLARIAAPAIRQEAPGKRIAGIDVSGVDYDFSLPFSRATLAGAGELFDIFSGHPYASPRYFGEGVRPLLPHENREAEKLRASLEMVAASGGRQRVWVGEKGWGLDIKEPLHGPHSFAYADCVAQALVTARAIPGIERYFWFLQHGANEGGYEYGLWRGSPRQPLPAAVAYASAARHLDHAQPRGLLRLSAGLAGHLFERQDPAQGMAVLWATGEAFHLAGDWPPGSRACGLMGRECSLAPLRVTGSPVFLTVPADQLDTLRNSLERLTPIPADPVRVDQIRLVSTHRLAARIANHQSHPLTLAPRVGELTAPAQTVEPGQTSAAVFDLSGSVRRLGWKTVPVDFLEAGRVAASGPLTLNLRSCPRRKSPLTVSLSDQGKPSTKVADRGQILPPDPTVGWEGPNDLSAEVWWGFDDERFYFAATVTDDIHVAPSPGAVAAWNGDSLVLGFDGDNDTSESPGYDGNDTELILAAAASGTQVHLTQPATSPEGVDCRIRREGTATLYQVAIPWTVLRVSPSPGRVFAFNFAVLDNDGAGRAYWMGPKPGLVEAKLPSQFMDLFLDEK